MGRSANITEVRFSVFFFRLFSIIQLLCRGGILCLLAISTLPIFTSKKNAGKTSFQFERRIKKLYWILILTREQKFTNLIIGKNTIDWVNQKGGKFEPNELKLKIKKWFFLKLWPVLNFLSKSMNRTILQQLHIFKFTKGRIMCNWLYSIGTPKVFGTK